MYRQSPSLFRGSFRNCDSFITRLFLDHLKDSVLMSMKFPASLHKECTFFYSNLHYSCVLPNHRLSRKEYCFVVRTAK